MPNIADSTSIESKVSNRINFNLVPGSYKIIRDDAGNIIDYQDIAFVGVASAWNKDIAGDVFNSGSYPQPVIDEYMKNPIVCINHCHHELNQTAGRMTALTNTPEGLLCEGIISNAPNMKDLRFKIVEGVYRSLSVCGVTRKQGGLEVFKRLDEISVVDIPCNPECQFKLKSKALADSKGEPEKLVQSADAEEKEIQKKIGAKNMDMQTLQSSFKAFAAGMSEFFKEEAGEAEHQKEEAKKEESKKEEAKKEECKCNKEEAKKEEAKKEEAKKEESKKEESKKKGLDMETEKQTEKSLGNDEIDKLVEKKLKIILPGYMDGFAPAATSGYTLQIKALPKPQQAFAHWMRKNLDDGTTGKFEMDMGCENKDNLQIMQKIAADPEVRKSLGSAMIMPDGRVMGNNQFYNFRDQERAIKKALDGTNGYGGDMTFEEISNLLFMRMYGKAEVSPQFIQVPMQSATMKHSEVWTELSVTGRSDQTGTGLESAPTTHHDTVTAQDFIGHTLIYDNVAQDSVFNLTSMVQQVMAIFIGRKLDSAILNGDNSATHMDCASVASHWGSSSGVDYQPVEFYWKGLRYYALADSGLKADLSALGATKAGLDAVVSKQGRYATYDPSNNLVIIGSKVHAKLRSDPQYALLYAAGNQWTMEDGKIKKYLGHDVVESFDMPENLGAAGIYGASDGSYGTIIGVNKTQFAVGLRKSMVFEILRPYNVRATLVRCHARFAFVPYEAPAAALPTCAIGYGVSV
jgi:hypothetical protein